MAARTPSRNQTPRQLADLAGLLSDTARKRTAHGLLCLGILLALCLALFGPAQVQAMGAGHNQAKIAKNLTTCAVDMKQDRFGSLRCLPTASLRELYNKSKADMEALRTNKVRACWRQPWEELRDTFLSIAISYPRGNLAAQSIYRAGECQEALALCSRLGEDYRMALGLYEAVAKAFPQSVRADDALFACARISAGNLHDFSGARDYLAWIERDFASSDHAPKARKMAATLPGKGSAQRQTLKNVTWESSLTSSRNGSVEVRLDFTKPVKVETRVVRQKKQDLVVCELGNTEVVSEIRRGLAVSDPLLRAVRVEEVTPQRTRLVLAFTDVARHSVTTKGKSLVLTVSSRVSPSVAKQLAHNKKSSPATRTATARKGSVRTASIAAPGNTLRVVTIDAGHGGVDPGTMHNGIFERSITLDVALRVGRLLTDNGIRVVYTRKSNRTVSLTRRSEIANENRSDLFVSIHVNANPKPYIRGMEVYYYGDSGQTYVADRENGKIRPRPKLRTVALTQRVLDSQSLAYDVLGQMKRRLARNGFAAASRGVKKGPFHVLSSTNMPSVLAEIGYCTNDRDAALLKTVAYRQALAEGIAEGILAYRDRNMGRLTAERKGRTTLQ